MRGITAWVMVVGSWLVAGEARAQRFACIGDFGMAGQPERDVAALVASWNPDFVITVGDNNYEYGEAATIDQNIGQYYHHYMYPYAGSYGAASPGAENRFFPSLGNHDWETGTAQGYLNFFTLPGNERYYEFARGNVRFFAIDSDAHEPDGTASTSAQAQWLRQRLAAATEPWKVVYFHHAPYSSGVYGDIQGMQWPFKAWGASLVMAGHNHHYERLTVDGLTYIVNGLGGRSLYGVGQPGPYTQALYAADYGAMLLNASANSLSMQFYTRTGQLIDAYTLLRTSTPLPVTLTALQARREGAAVQLSWTTAQELRCRGFGVEVSADGLQYREIGFVAGAGSSSAPRHYAFTDAATSPPGLRYYRLRQDDEQGLSTYFGPVPVPVEAGPASLSTYPNPFGPALTVDVTLPAAAPVVLTLTDDQGRVVWQAEQAGQAGLNHLVVTPPLPPGLYQASARVGARRLQQRLVKL
ncbi:metallophosphoesterase [Hymenobacter sp. 15J16-1T3B]|uniref:metallophosphoesterase family protein n=1 Tax=Hymenobacter sp. 15J16-1T3B TaxID=2886941 RepID=UPI001D0F5897|nr:metallophosphoesterase [Hymenobacter sp. 15J16-1T3B]MCC3160292.1 metallophosphoesterase [Hymenobacter sp. 15J16-1T3B]